jgi:hypothetical protein
MRKATTDPLTESNSPPRRRSSATVIVVWVFAIAEAVGIGFVLWLR